VNVLLEGFVLDASRRARAEPRYAPLRPTPSSRRHASPVRMMFPLPGMMAFDLPAARRTSVHAARYLSDLRFLLGLRRTCSGARQNLLRLPGSTGPSAFSLISEFFTTLRQSSKFSRSSARRRLARVYRTMSRIAAESPPAPA